MCIRDSKYIVRNEPWALAGDPQKKDRLDTVLYNLAECLCLLTLVLSPVMPGTAAKMAAGLGLAADNELIANLDKGGMWGLFPVGTSLRKIEVLFPRIERVQPEADTGRAIPQKREKGKIREKKDEGLITLEQFRAVDLRVAEVVAAEKIENSEKLLKLTVKVPEERTVVAGIAEFYSPDEMIGRQVLMVVNLVPAKLMGVTSHGMLLAAKLKVDGKERLVLSTVDDRVEVGSKVA
jgi:methionyl-tRNA synthetase